jgi:ribosomal protein L37AE/L43A
MSIWLDPREIEELGAGMLAALARPWCNTCNCAHVANMPAYTWRCRECGFGAQSSATAAGHALRFPEHEVYPIFHRMTIESGEKRKERSN